MISQLGMGILLGLTLLVLGPPLLRRSRFGEWIGNVYAAVAMQTLGRPSISVGANTDLSLRKRAFDDTFDAETLTVGGEEKKITMTPGTTLRWGSRPFTFVDEKWGSTFDLRDVAFGRAFVELVRDGSFAFREWVRNDEGEIVDVRGYVRAFLQPAGGTLSMDLGESVRPMIDGNEDATAWNRVWEGVRRMFLPYQDPVALLKLALPGIMLFGGVLAAYYLFGPGRLPGAPPSRTVSVGAGSLLLIAGRGKGVRERVRGLLAWIRHWQGVIGAVLVGVGLVAVGVQFAPTTTAIVLIAAVATLVAVPLGSATVMSLLPASIAEGVAESWLTIGFKSFDDPVIEQDDENRIAVVEGDGSGPRYRFCKSFVGFDLACSPDAFGRAGVQGKDLQEYRTDTRADGGHADLPTGCVVTEQVTNADHKGFLPTFDASDSDERARREETFVRTDRWLARFADAATGKMCERAQQEATKEFADGSAAMSDRSLMLLSIGAGLGGLVGGGLLWGLML